MNDKDLYQQILGLGKPWVVESVEVDHAAREIVVEIGLKGSVVLCCPECEEPMPGYDTREREWRHLDTCQYRTIIRTQVPRGKCSEHGVRQIRVPWAEPGSQFSALFERLAIDWLSETSQSGVGRCMDLSWSEVHGIMKRAVERGLRRRELKEVHLLGVDEKSHRKRHDYVTVVCNLEDGAVLHVGDGRKKETLDRFYTEELTEKQREEIYAVAMDMWPAYIESTKEHLKGADIVFDKFHIVKHLSDAVDKVRRKENKALRQEGDDRLIGTRFDWLRREEDLHPARRAAFDDLKRSNLKTARAWAIKETATKLWDYTYEASARKYFSWWYGWARRSKLEPIKDVALMIKRHLDNVLTYLKIHITNAMAEAVNSKIQWIKYTARGFRSRENFKVAILFHCGKLQLYPHGI